MFYGQPRGVIAFSHQRLTDDEAEKIAPADRQAA
jgi:hypothetical protein